jgi:putative transcriptional regulator
MTAITHHIRDDLITAYVAGNLPHAFAVLVAAHVSLCDECRAMTEAVQLLGGLVLDDMQPVAVSGEARARALARLDSPRTAQRPQRREMFPAPVMQALGGNGPKWKPVGNGIKQQILSADATGSLRLLFIPPGRAVPEHGHRGLELTLVLQGSFSDGGGVFATGDVETADGEVDHQPLAGPGEACICLAATDAPLRFHALLPRLLQPLLRI